MAAAAGFVEGSAAVSDLSYEAGMDAPQPVLGSCHCGAVQLSVPHAPAWVGSCNCSLCTKLGWLVAYYPDQAVNVQGETAIYIWGDRMIGIHHCPTCGCGTHWRTLGEDFGRMGINARLLNGFDAAQVEVRLLDNRGP